MIIIQNQSTEFLILIDYTYFFAELWSDGTFKTGRQEALESLSNLLKQDPISTSSTSPSSSSSAAAAAADTTIRDTLSSNNKLILVDDIMHLKSMRKQVFQLCRLHRAPLLTVYVSTPLEIALQRNRARIAETAVSEASLRKLFEEFEVPDARFVHDRHVVSIDTSCLQM